MAKHKLLCHICKDRLLNYKNYLKCSICNHFSHPKCNDMSKSDAIVILNNSDIQTKWVCSSCSDTKYVCEATSTASTDCHSCLKPLGKQHVTCIWCDQQVHHRCNKLDLGCHKCNADIFPHGEDLFHVTNSYNDHLFDPYNLDLKSNRIGDFEGLSPDSDLLHTLSRNLTKCNYTTLDKLKANNDELSILSLNIRSLKTNFHKLQLIDHKLTKFDVVCLQETGIDPDDMFSPGFYDLDGFHSPTMQKPSRGSCKGGGLAIYVNSGTFDVDSIKVLGDFNDCSTPQSGELLLVELSTGQKSKNVIIGNLYRSPAFAPDLFCDKVNSHIEQLLNRHPGKDLTVLGDINIDLLQHDTYKPAQTLVNLMSQNALIPVISRPTHISEKSATLIDHIFTNSLTRFRSSGVITDPIADHLGTYIKLGHSNNNQPKLPSHYNFTDYSDENIRRFKEILQNTDWGKILCSASDSNDMFERFHHVFTTLYDKIFPTTLRKCNNRKGEGKPWIMPWLQEACDRKNSLYDDFVKTPTTENNDKYIKMKKWVEKQLNTRKKQYYSQQIETYTSNAKKQWKIINSVISNKKPSTQIKKLTTPTGSNITDNKSIAESFNEYFCNIAENLKREIPTPTYSVSHECKPEPSSIFLQPCSESEVATIIKELKNSSTSDYNVLVIKQISLTTPLVSILTQSINASFTDGIFPQLLKTAKVIPIYKSGSKADTSNYRPISLLSIFSKIYEKTMSSRLVSFFNRNKTLYPRQYGFRSLHSCEHALLDAQNTILSTLDKKQVALLLLIDFSKAFDMVDHSILLNKLNNYGIRGTALKWMASYLNNRNQYVYVNNTKSNIRNLKYGVPQGSILGPLLFIIYINDLPNIDTAIHFIMYADDANIIITGSNIHEIKAKAETLLIQLSNWVSSNSLKLNVKKTHFMIFSNSKNRGNYDLTLHLNSEIISQSHEERFLGVILDDRLTFSTHKAAIATKVSRNAGILFRARHMFKLQTLKTLYSSFIQSHLIFCSFIWGTGAKSSLQGIFVAQKKAIRAITYTRLYTKDRVTEMYSYGHTKLLFNSLGLLTVHNLILVQMLSQMHKIYRAVAPVHIRGYFKPQSPPLTTEQPTKHDIMPPRGLDSDNIIPDHNELINHKLYYTIPLTRLAKHKQTIIYQGPLTYNYFCNKIQTLLNDEPKYKHQIHKLTPKSFLAHVKRQIITEQSDGLPNTWENLNTPMYVISTCSLTLRPPSRLINYLS